MNKSFISFLSVFFIFLQLTAHTPGKISLSIPCLAILQNNHHTNLKSHIQALFQQSLQNGKQANEGFIRCLNFVNGWLKYSDPQTGLIPRNLQKDRDIWNAKDCAADNYPFMVLTSSILDQSLFQGRMLKMLQTERKLTSRIGHLPDTYSFSKQDFQYSEADLNRIMFGASEYIKDGLLPLTEWLGNSPWSERMIEILDDMWKYAPIKTNYGNLVSTNVEVNGEMLQTLSRVYWMTGDEKYLEWAIRLGDYYLLGGQHPTRDLRKLRLRDHGCEIVSGLCELYATLHFARPEKKKVYQSHIHEMLDRILQVGRNEHGLFYNVIDPVNGKILNDGIADTWGYTYNGFYTVYLIDGIEKYRQATLEALSHLNDHYRNFDWEHGSADGYADAIESALNLLNREPLSEVAEWVDSQIKVMWNKQQPEGIIEGWHGDGNFARTTIMYCLWKTQGVTIDPWRKDLIYGAMQENGQLYLNIFAKANWRGKVVFDKPRHRLNIRLPLDWPRINQFPEWFTISPDCKYMVEDVLSGDRRIFSGKELIEGIPLKLQSGQEKRYLVREIKK